MLSGLKLCSGLYLSTNYILDGWLDHSPSSLIWGISLLTYGVDQVGSYFLSKIIDPSLEELCSQNIYFCAEIFRFDIARQYLWVSE